MNEKDTLSEKLRALKIARENFKKIVVEAMAFTELAEAIEKMLDKRTLSKSNMDLIELEAIDSLITTGPIFKPTSTIADFLRIKSSRLEHLNNYQLGILLSKAGFKNATKYKKRGYYVKYKEL